MLDSIYADLILLGAVMLFAHWLHNRLNNLISDALIVALGLVMALYFIENPAQAVVFVVGTALGYMIEYFGVHTRAWRYNTRNGYSNWTGTGWGLLILLIYKAEVGGIGWPALLALLAVSLLIVLRLVKNNSIRDWFDVLDFGVRGLALLIAPEIFVLAFSLGIFVEYIGTEMFRTWVYPTIRYINLGTGYSLLVILVLRVTDYAFGLRELSPLPLVVIGLFAAVYLLGVMRSLPPESWLRRLPGLRRAPSATPAGD
jgi:hypothetical protein